MSAAWFYSAFPPSRSVIENELRLAFWKAGLGNMWLSCTKEEPPYICEGSWRDTKFKMEWETGKYLTIQSNEPNQALLDAFDRLLGHRALAAYRNGEGKVVIEWRAKDGAARLQELQSSGVRDLEPLNK